MKAIKIDVANRWVKEIELEPGLDPIYKELDCETFTVPFVYDNMDGLYVDDESLLKDYSNILGAFRIKEYPYQAFLGNGLIIGADEMGEPEDVGSSVEFIREQVTFLTHEEAKQEYDRLNNLGIDIHVF